MKARSKEIYDENGSLQTIEVTLETDVHLFDAQWDPREEQNEENRNAFRKWVKRIASQHGHELT